MAEQNAYKKERRNQKPQAGRRLNKKKKKKKKSIETMETLKWRGASPPQTDSWSPKAFLNMTLLRTEK